MEKQKSIRKNYVYNVSYQILTLITPLITTPYISRVLGADGIGRVSFVESIVSYFVLFATMGISIYGQREISYVQDSKYKRSIVFWNAKVLQIVSTLMVLIIYIFFVVHNGDNRKLYLILGINIIAVFFDVTWFLQGMEEFGKTVIRNIVIKAINIIYIFGVVKGPKDIEKYVLGICFFTLLSNVSLLFHMPKYVVRVRVDELSPLKALPIVLSLFIPTIAIQIYTVLDKTMIGLITKDSYENGFYEQAIKISRILIRIVTSLGTVIAPRMGYYYEKKNNEMIKSLMYQGYRFIWLLGTPLCIGIIVLSSNFVPWFFGSGYEEVSSLLKILALLIVVIGISNVTGIQYLIPTKRQNILTYTVVIGATINLLLNLLLIPILKSKGAAIASVIAEAVITLIQLFTIRKEINVLQIVKEGKNYYIAGLSMGVIIYFFEKVSKASIFNTVVWGMIGSLLYGAILLLLRDELFLSIFSKKVDKSLEVNNNGKI